MNSAYDTVIKVDSVSKLYRVYDRPSNIVREILTGRKSHQERWALRDVSFDVARGEVMGVLGANGAGKSTLLKIIAGTLLPSSGAAIVGGKISAILELGTGFNPQFTGRQNVFMGGMCLGMKRKQIEEKFEWIVEFSELSEVIDQPFRTYSSGMQARLTFATAISVDAEILIIDEALAAGDAAFVSKCMRRIREVCESGATVLFVSHSTYSIIELCDRAVFLDKGKLQKIGDAYPVVKEYERFLRESSNARLLDRAASENARRKQSFLGATSPSEISANSTAKSLENYPIEAHAQKIKVGEISNEHFEETIPPDGSTDQPSKFLDSLEIIDVISADSDGVERYVFHTGEDIYIRIGWKGRTEANQVAVGLRIDGQRIPAVTGFSSSEENLFLSQCQTGLEQGTFLLKLRRPNFGAGLYFATIGLYSVGASPELTEMISLADRAITFEIVRNKLLPYTYVCEIKVELEEI